MAVTVYGIKSCDTVRKARKWLDGHDADHTFVDFRAVPVGRERVRRRPLQRVVGQGSQR